jgi:serine/threonine protein phosphatase PrpC
MIQFSAVTDIGRRRKDNQDCYCTSEKPPYVYAVCDGMGGHAAGDMASRCAVSSIQKYFELNTPFDIDDNKAKNLLHGALDFANKLILSRADKMPDCKGMGTTADVCLVYFDNLYIGHVGDSRVYMLRRGKLSQITRDHSLVEKLIEEGTITRDEAKNHPNRNVITSALGTDEELTWDFYHKTLEHGDLILMCSDGVHEMLTDEQIRNALVSDIDIENIANTLVNEANLKGGTDNITAVVLKYIVEQRCGK